jgi:hypothetical protein
VRSVCCCQAGCAAPCTASCPPQSRKQSTAGPPALQGKRRKSEGGKEEGRKWTAHEIKSLEEKLFALGPGRTQEVQQQVCALGCGAGRTPK